MKRSQYAMLLSVFVFLMLGVWTSLTMASDINSLFNGGENVRNRLEDVSKLYGDKVKMIDPIYPSFYSDSKGMGRSTSYKPKLLNTDMRQIEARRLSKSNADICPHGYILYETFSMRP